jgi:hypothetical protein
MKKFARFMPLIACLSTSVAIAGDFDGSKPLICAPVEAMSCASGQPCASGRPVDVGAPAFFRVDVAKKTIAGPKHTTQIRMIEKGKDQLQLQGTEFGLAWTLVLNTADGTISATYLDRDDVTVLFGSCTPL